MNIMKKCLNLGCQIHHFDSSDTCEWINNDVMDDPNIKIELRCDSIKLPLEDESIDFIYAGHLVEHFYPDTLPIAIKEWHRVLKKGGKLVIVAPDCGAVFKDYAVGRLSIERIWQQIYGRIYAYDRESERHHIAFDNKKLHEIVGSNETWEVIEGLDFGNPPKELAPFMDTHISRGIYQLGIILTK